MIAITGATGFVGRELVSQLSETATPLRCWYRSESSRAFADDLDSPIDWIEGELGDVKATNDLVDGCDAVVHAALWKPGASFRGGEGDVVEFTRVNLLGSLQLIEAAFAAGVSKFVFVSTCAVHEKILDDRPLDETHPTWPFTHYGAHKAAIEKFVHSYGLGKGFPICAIRPTGIYGADQPVWKSKWFPLIEKIIAGEMVEVKGGGKEVHVNDVAKGIQVLLNAESVAGEVYACYDRYVSQYEVAIIAKDISGSPSRVVGESASPKHEIQTGKLRALGMEFGGTGLLEKTISQLIEEI